MEITNPLKPMDYINEVLVPETASMLISQDYGDIPLDNARKVLKESREFGIYIHDIDNVWSFGYIFVSLNLVLDPYILHFIQINMKI